MAEIRFYHLTRSPLEAALPRLLDKALGQGMRAVLRCADEARVAQLDDLLWTWDAGSFLPHGSARDGSADQQPIWITQAVENPNAAALLVLVDAAPAPDIDAYSMVCDMFDGRDPETVAAARQRWRLWREGGHGLTYWQQRDAGGWEQAG